MVFITAQEGIAGHTYIPGNHHVNLLVPLLSQLFADTFLLGLERRFLPAHVHFFPTFLLNCKLLLQILQLTNQSYTTWG